MTEKDQILLTEKDQTLVILKANLHRTQQAMKNYVDGKRTFAEFQVGDMVLVKLQPYRQHFVSLHPNQKLGLRYFGHFPITEKICIVAYKVLLPPSAKNSSGLSHCQLKIMQGQSFNSVLSTALTHFFYESYFDSRDHI